MNITDDSYATLSRAYSKSNLDLWDQNFVNGEYIVAFELSPHLHDKIQSMLPKVGLKYSIKIVYFIIFWLYGSKSLLVTFIIDTFKAMRKIEEVTCIKFEERSKNHHQELVSYI